MTITNGNDIPTVKVDLENIPSLLRGLPRWLTWNLQVAENGKPQKKPDQSTLHPGRPWQAVEKTARNRKGGIGFIVTGTVKVKGGYLIALDLDACRDPISGDVKDWAMRVVTAFGNTYTAISPSGTGLHVWLIVKELPKDRIGSKVRVLGDPAENTGGKKPELQIFGLGPALYITVSGNQLPGTKNWLCVGPSIDWLIDEFRLDKLAGEGSGAMPVGEGTPPSTEAVLAQVTNAPKGELLLAAKWHETGHTSASEAFHELAKHVLGACQGHGDAAVDFLMTTVWGQGLVDDSRDPNKYARQGWVEAEIRRVHTKHPLVGCLPTDVFDALSDDQKKSEPSNDSGDVNTTGSSTSSTSTTSTTSTTDTPLWRRFAFQELLQTTLSPWIIRNYFRAGQLGFLIAYTTVGKSTLAAAWAMSVLYGRDWCGKQVRAGSVVCLVGEGRRGFVNRLEAFRRHHGLGELPQGRYLEIVDLKTPLSGKQGQAAAKRLVEQITADRGHPPILVLVDTLSSHWAESEDSAEFAGPAMRALAGVAEQHGCAVLVLHHTLKGKGRLVMPELSDARGSGVFVFNSDFVLGMCATTEGAILAGLKLKDDELPPKLHFQLHTITLGIDADDQPVTAGVFGDQGEPVGSEGSKDTALTERGRVFDLIVRHGPCARLDVQEHTGMSKKVALGHLDALAETGQVERIGFGRNVRYAVSSLASFPGNETGTKQPNDSFRPSPVPKDGDGNEGPKRKRGRRQQRRGRKNTVEPAIEPAIAREEHGRDFLAATSEGAP